MPGPWEQYQAKPSGPWEKYAAPQPAQPQQPAPQGDSIDSVYGDLGLSRPDQGAMRRQVGLAGRAVAGGVADIVAPLVDFPVSLLNRAADTIAGRDAPGIPSLASSVDSTATRLGVPQAETPLEQGVQTAGRIQTGLMTGGAMTRAVMNRLGFGTPAPTTAPRSQQQQVLQAGQQEGYVVPPNTSNPNALTGTLEGASGKIKTAQLASQRNQAVTNRLAARALGLPDDTPVTPEILDSVRAEAGKAYEAVRSAGTIQTDTQFRTAVTSAIRRFKDAAADFPKLAQKELFDIAEDINKPSFDSGSGIDAIALLRDRADAAFRAGDKSLGNSYKALSSALEGAIERSLAKGGQDASGLLEGFKAARQAIAKTYTVQGALRGSNVDAAALARALNKGKPLSEELRLVGEFAQEFPKATRMLNESIPAYSPLDMWSGAASVGAAVGTSNPAMLAPAAYSFLRPGLRNALLSPAGQRLAVQGGQGTNALAGPAIGAAGPLNALLPVPLNAEPNVR